MMTVKVLCAAGFMVALSTGPKTAEGRARIAEAARRRWELYRLGRDPSFRPAPYVPKGQGGTIIDLYCPHCLPPWEMRDVRLDQPPWSTVTLGKDQSFACPGCRRRVLMHTRKEPTTATAFAPWSHLSPGSGRKR